MDDVQSDDTLLQNINLCLETENDDLNETELPSYQKLNSVLLAFDRFRGSFFQEPSVGIENPSSGFYIPSLQINYLNPELYQSFADVTGSENRLNLINFFNLFYKSFINNIQYFSEITTETYAIAKYLSYFIETEYLPNVSENADGVFRKSVDEGIQTTEIELDSVENITNGMYVRGPYELGLVSVNGQVPTVISNVNDLPVVTNIDEDTTTVTVSKPTYFSRGDFILFNTPELNTIDFFFNQDIYPLSSQPYFLGLQQVFDQLSEFIIDNNLLTEDVVNNVNVENNSFFIEQIDGVEEKPILYLAEGLTVRFDQSNESNLGRPLQFSTTPDGTHNGGTVFTNNVTVVGRAGIDEIAYIEIKVTENTPNLYYFSEESRNMGNEIVILN
tara:strand:+ start:1380 stop:2543 length:1164 start_codon:yes stop_codon:yes gene_type:complete